MTNRKLTNICILICLVGVTGCTQKSPASEPAIPRQTEQITEDQAFSSNTDIQTMDNQAQNIVGQGFRPPKGSHTDKNGNIVDKEGNTFKKDGSWEVPEGGHVDAQGRIIDKYGNVMGGGAKVGSKG